MNSTHETPSRMWSISRDTSANESGERPFNFRSASMSSFRESWSSSFPLSLCCVGNEVHDESIHRHVRHAGMNVYHAIFIPYSKEDCSVGCVARQSYDAIWPIAMTRKTLRKREWFEFKVDIKNINVRFQMAQWSSGMIVASGYKPECLTHSICDRPRGTSAVINNQSWVVVNVMLSINLVQIPVEPNIFWIISLT